MKISIELNQEWDTTSKASNYFQSIADTLRRIGGEYPDAPREWYLHTEEVDGDGFKLEVREV